MLYNKLGIRSLSVIAMLLFNDILGLKICFCGSLNIFLLLYLFQYLFYVLNLSIIIYLPRCLEVFGISISCCLRCLHCCCLALDLPKHSLKMRSLPHPHLRTIPPPLLSSFRTRKSPPRQLLQETTAVFQEKQINKDPKVPLPT